MPSGSQRLNLYGSIYDLNYPEFERLVYALGITRDHLSPRFSRIAPKNI